MFRRMRCFIGIDADSGIPKRLIGAKGSTRRRRRIEFKPPENLKPKSGQTREERREKEREMELSCCSSTSLISSSSYLPLKTTKPTKPSSLSSSNSVFFSKKRLSSLVCVRRRGSEAGPTSRRLGCRCLFGLGVPELVVIAGVAALVFGPKQLPEIGRNIGKTVKSFQQAAKEFETELKKEPEVGSEPSSAESAVEGPKAVSNGDKKKELETSGTKENV